MFFLPVWHRGSDTERVLWVRPLPSQQNLCLGHRRTSGVTNTNSGIRWFEYEDAFSIKCEAMADPGYVERGGGQKAGVWGTHWGPQWGPRGQNPLRYEVSETNFWTILAILAKSMNNNKNWLTIVLLIFFKTFWSQKGGGGHRPNGFPFKIN